MVFETLRRVLAEQFGVEEASITMASTLEEDLGVDSLDLVEITMLLEEEFEVGEIEDEALMALRTVGDIVELVSSRSPE